MSDGFLFSSTPPFFFLDLRAGEEPLNFTEVENLLSNCLHTSRPLLDHADLSDLNGDPSKKRSNQRRLTPTVDAEMLDVNIVAEGENNASRKRKMCGMNDSTLEDVVGVEHSSSSSQMDIGRKCAEMETTKDGQQESCQTAVKPEIQHDRVQDHLNGLGCTEKRFGRSSTRFMKMRSVLLPKNFSARQAFPCYHHHSSVFSAAPHGLTVAFRHRLQRGNRKRSGRERCGWWEKQRR